MDKRITRFLESVLGTDGAQALHKAAERSKELEQALLPRAVLAWLNVADSYQFEGELPGVKNTYLRFEKHEDAMFSGTIGIQDSTWSFERVPIYKVAASIAVALGADELHLDPRLRDQQLQRLGKSIDLLAKARALTTSLLTKKVLDPTLGYRIEHELHEVQPGVHMTRVNAYAPTGEHVGSAAFIHQGDRLLPGHIVVGKGHAGLANAMYAHAEKASGKKLLPSHAQQEHFGKNEDLGKMAIKDLKPGPQIPAQYGGYKAYDYSHLLSPEQRAAGYGITVQHNGFRSRPGRYNVEAHLLHQGKRRGSLLGSADSSNKGDSYATVAQADLNEHAGKGLGVPMYEAFYTHAYHHLGARQAEGGGHATAASKVHQKLSAKHGLNYKPEVNGDLDSDREPGRYDNRFAPYQYALKADGELGKTVLDPAAGYQISGHDVTNGGLDEGLYGGEGIEPMGDLNSSLLEVRTHDRLGNRVGSALLEKRPDRLYPLGLHVDPRHRRLGVASAMLAHAERATGLKVRPEGSAQTAQGRALVAGNSNNKQFGKDDPELAAKAEGPGPAAPPRAPGAPQAAQPPQKQPKAHAAPTAKPGPPKVPPTMASVPKIPAPKIQQGVKLPKLKLSEFQAKTSCKMCEQPQFKDNRFVGCFCFSDLAPMAKSQPVDGGFELQFGGEWDQDSVEALVKTLRLG